MDKRHTFFISLSRLYKLKNDNLKDNQLNLHQVIVKDNALILRFDSDDCKNRKIKHLASVNLCITHTVVMYGTSYKNTYKINLTVQDNINRTFSIKN